VTTSDDPDWTAGLAERIEEESRSRTEDPSTFLVEVLRHYWLDSTPDEADRLWRVTVRDQPFYAVDVLNCLYRISEDPPADLVDLIVGRSEVVLHLEGPDGRLVPFGVQDYARWLRAVHDRWHPIFLASRSG